MLVAIAGLLVLIIVVTNEHSDEVVSRVQMSWRVEVVEVAIVRRRHDELVAKSLGRQNHDWFQFFDVEMNE